MFAPASSGVVTDPAGGGGEGERADRRPPAAG
jgi:hypothetical protein